MITLSLPFACCIGLDVALRPEPLPTPAGSTLLGQLFLTSEDFPDARWMPDPNGPGEACSSAPLGSGCESAEAQRLFYHGPTGHAYQTVHIYYSAEDAAADFLRVVNGELQTGARGTDWTRPPDWAVVTQRANEALFKCHINWPGLPQDCVYISRYDQFIVIFFSSVDALNLTEFHHVIEAIDLRMARALSGTLSPVPGQSEER